MPEDTYEYVVIGAGIAGLSAAYHLSKDGHSVLVLEAAAASVKDSASFASTAEMNHDPDANWEKIVEKFGREGARLIWKLGAHGIDHLSEFAHSLNEQHFNSDRVPAYIYSYTTDSASIDSLEKKYDFYKSIDAHVSLEENPSAIHENFRAVLTTHGEGVTNNQELLARLAHQVREHGGEILHERKVVSVTGQHITTAGGDVFSAKKVIVATGDGAGLLPESIEIERKRTFVISLESPELPELFKNSVLWDTDEPYHYIRSFAGNRLWVGGEDVYDSEYVHSEEKDEKKYTVLSEYAREVLGTDDTYARQAAWSGLFFPSKRGLPYIGEVPDTSIIASTGFGGTGIITSFMSGYLLAAWERGEMLEYKPLFALGWK